MPRSTETKRRSRRTESRDDVRSRPFDVRQQYADVFGEGVPMVRALVNGHFPLREVCPKCGHKGDEVVLPSDAKDSLRALDIAGHYGLGAKGEYSEDVVQDNLDRMMTAAEALVDRETFNVYARQVDAIWNRRRRG